jgi:hypothetical protein
MNARRVILGALLAVPVIILLCLLVDYLIVTEPERVSATLRQLARDLEANDVDAVVQHISSSSSALRDEARTGMAQFVVHKAVVKRNLEVTVGRDRMSPVAEARFNGVAVLSDRAGMVTQRTVARFFVVNLRKEGGQWRVSRYEDHDPIRRRQ